MTSSRSIDVNNAQRNRREKNRIAQRNFREKKKNHLNRIMNTLQQVRLAAIRRDIEQIQELVRSPTFVKPAEQPSDISSSISSGVIVDANAGGSLSPPLAAVEASTMEQSTMGQSSMEQNTTELSAVEQRVFESHIVEPNLFEQITMDPITTDQNALVTQTSSPASFSAGDFSSLELSYNLGQPFVDPFLWGMPPLFPSYQTPYLDPQPLLPFLRPMVQASPWDSYQAVMAGV